MIGGTVGADFVLKKVGQLQGTAPFNELLGSCCKQMACLFALVFA